MTDIDSSLDYSVSEHTHSTLHFRNVAPQSSSNVTLGAASTSGPISFVISSSVFNPARSKLNFELNLTSTADAGTWNYVQSNLLKAISRITIYDQNTSAILADINNCGNTYSILNPIATKFDDFIHKNQPLAAAGSTSAVARLQPYEDMGKINAATNYLGAVDTAANNPYFQLRNVINSGANQAGVLFCSIPFSAFKHSFFALDKMVYSPSSLQIDVYFAGYDTFCWKAPSQTDLSTNAATQVAAPTLTGSQFLVQLCTEGNVQLATQVIQKTMSSGISMPIGYVSSAKFVIGASTSQSWTIPLTAAYGKRILYTAFAPFNTAETLSTSNNHSKYGTSTATPVITSYNTYLNSVPILAPGGFDISNRSDDYLIANKQYLDGSVIQNASDYSYNWVHIDNYARTKICELDPSQSDGLDVVSQQANYQLQATTTNTALNWYLAIVGQKTLNISSQGVMVN